MTGRSEYQLLLKCIGTNSEDEGYPSLSQLLHKQDLNWELFYHIADVHRVIPRVFIRLCRPGPLRIQLPIEVRNRLEYFFRRNIAIKTFQREELERALRFLRGIEADVMIIKGAALDLVLPDAIWQRSYGDVDLVLRLDVKSDERQNAILRFLGDLKGFEYDFLEHHDVNMNGVLKVDFNEVWQDSNEVDFRGYPIRVMSSEDMLIAACVSSCRKRFARLKWMNAIAEIVGDLSDLSWETLIRKSRSYECENIVYTGLLATVATLGIKLPSDLLNRLFVPPIKRSVIRFLVKRLAEFSVPAGWRIPVIQRNLGMSLLLPYASYSWSQRIQKIGETLNLK